jgi:hypothetical protein
MPHLCRFGAYRSRYFAVALTKFPLTQNLTISKGCIASVRERHCAYLRLKGSIEILLADRTEWWFLDNPQSIEVCVHQGQLIFGFFSFPQLIDSSINPYQIITFYGGWRKLSAFIKPTQENYRFNGVFL